jgi:hypothetical protein
MPVGRRAKKPRGMGATPRAWTASEEARREGGPLKRGKKESGPPERCDTYNPRTANRAPPLPGDHDQLYQVAISQSPLRAPSCGIYGASSG